MSVREKAVLLLKSQVTHISPQRMTKSSGDTKPGWFWETRTSSGEQLWSQTPYWLAVIFLELHCSLRLILPNSPFSLSFTGKRSPLWFDSSPCLLQLPPFCRSQICCPLNLLYISFDHGTCFLQDQINTQFSRDPQRIWKPDSLVGTCSLAHHLLPSQSLLPNSPTLLHVSQDLL